MASPLPTYILLTSTNDRRCFDLFHWLKHRHRAWQFVVIGHSLSRLDRWLYPGLQALGASSTAELLTKITGQPAQYIYLPWLEPELEEMLALRASWPPNLKLLLPEATDFATARNKTSFTARFQTAGLTPRLYSLSDLQQNFPATGVVAKPAIGKSAIGRQFITSPSQLSLIHPNDVIQERLGEGKAVVGAFYLRIDGQIKAQYLHRRIRTYPENGGVSVCAETFDQPEILQRGVQILEDLNWEGLAMIEFLERPATGEWLAIELNPRLWGSVLLGEYAGHALVEQYICHCAGWDFVGSTPKPKAYLRWYFPYELLYVLKKPLQRWPLLSLRTADTCYVSATHTGVGRAVLFVLKSVLDPYKWQMMLKKTFGWR
jgi:hypothetical protein